MYVVHINNENIFLLAVAVHKIFNSVSEGSFLTSNTSDIYMLSTTRI